MLLLLLLLSILKLLLLFILCSLFSSFIFEIYWCQYNYYIVAVISIVVCCLLFFVVGCLIFVRHSTINSGIIQGVLSQFFFGRGIKKETENSRVQNEW